MEKIQMSGEHPTQSIPLNAVLNGQGLSSQCSIFALGQREHTSSPRGLIGSIVPSFWERAVPPGVRLLLVFGACVGGQKCAPCPNNLLICFSI